MGDKTAGQERKAPKWLGTVLAVAAIVAYYYFFGTKVGDECGGFLQQCRGCATCYRMGSSKTCANSCSSDGDCEAGFECDKQMSPQVCVRK